MPKDLNRYFSVLKKYMNKFDCLVNEMLLIRELTPSLNVQSDSIQAKLLRDIGFLVSRETVVLRRCESETKIGVYYVS